MGFYQNFIKKCEEKKVSPSRAAQDVGLSNAAASGWKNGKEPNDLTLQKLATYFGCDVADLTGESYVSAGGKAHWKGSGVEVAVPEQNIEIDQPAENDELADELQWLKDSPTTRSILKASKGLTEGQLKAIEEIMIQMRGSE